MICPSCNKFASYDEPEVEVNASDISDDGSITVDGRMVLRSACCGDELKEWNFTLEADCDHDTKDGKHELEIDCDDVEASDYYDNPGRPMRYRRHVYIAGAVAKVTCSCGFSTDIELHDENQATGFDELT